MKVISIIMFIMFEWIEEIRQVAADRRENETRIGHGLGTTI